MDKRGVDFQSLPEGCIANVLSFTSPLDVCRLSSVSSIFRSAADSDAVWKRFLPDDYQAILARSADAASPRSLSLKDLYFRLCHDPVLIDEGTKSFSVDKWSGKKCFMLSARALSIVWGDTPRYWRWTPCSDPKSRFEEVAVLMKVCWLEIRGKIDTSLLSPSTRYSAYFVFAPGQLAYGFEHQPVEVKLGDTEKTVYLDMDTWRRQQYQIVPRFFRPFGVNRGRVLGPEVPAATPREDMKEGPKERKDGWLEIEMGEFFTEEGGANGEIEMSLLEVKGGNWKGGLIVQGIEIRPKVDGK